jgi:beta-glucanase (GH16 family)
MSSGESNRPGSCGQGAGATVRRVMGFGVVAAMLATVTACPPTTPTPSSEFDSTPFFVDEFSGSGRPDWPTWKLGDGFSWNDEWNTARPKNVRVEGGRMVIEAHAEEFEGKHFTSSMAWSTESFLFGKFEARIRVPTGTGTWAGFWFNCVPGPETVPERDRTCNPPWPAGGEIDMLEHVANPTMAEGLGWAHSNLHLGRDALGYLDNHRNTSTLVDPPAGPAGWHTYGVEWVPGEIRFFIDGRRTATHRKSDEGPNGWWPFDTVPQEMRFALQLGGWVGTVDASAMPQQMQIDWVRGYRYVGPR